MILNQKGTVPLLALLTIIGLISFSVFVNTVGFKSELFSSLFPKPPSHAQMPSLYVDIRSKGGTCSDNNSGTIIQPFCTITKAISAASPGYAIYLREGTYPSFRITKSGNINAPIVITSYNGENVVIDAAGSPYGIYSYLPNFIEISNLDIKGATGDWEGGIHFYGGGNNVIKNNKIHDNFSGTNWTFGILVSNSTNTIISGNETYNNGVGIRIDSSNGLFSTNNQIIGNYSHHNTVLGGNSDGIHIGGDANNTNNVIKDNKTYDNADDGIDTWISSGNIVEGNISYNQLGPGDGNGFKMGGLTTGGNNTIRFNLSYNNKMNGFDSNGSGGNKYYHNVSYNNGNYGFEDGWRNNGSLGCPSTDRCLGVFSDNIGYNNKVANFSAGKYTKSSDYNLWYKDGVGAFVKYDYYLYNSLLSFNSASGGFDTNSLSVAPQFVNANLADFHLINTAPGIDKGNPTNPATVSVCGNGPDIGRYEFCPNSTPSPTVTPSIAPPPPTPIPTLIPTDTTPPNISISSPLNGGNIARNSNFTIDAMASDNVAVTKIEFLVDGGLKCTDLILPYSCSTRVGGKPGGKHIITAKATDSSGNTAISSVSVIAR